MKKFLLISIIFFAFLSSRAQEVLPVPDENYPKPIQVKEMESKFLCCPKCDFTALVSGVCPNHQIPLVKVDFFYCPVSSGYTSNIAGICPEHKTALTQMHMKYQKIYPPVKQNDEIIKTK